MSAAKKEETILVDFSAGVDPAATDQRILSTQGWPGPTLLALDLGLDCGWCLVLDGRYKESGVVDLRPTDDQQERYYGPHFVAFEAWLPRLDGKGVTLLVTEHLQHFPSVRSAQVMLGLLATVQRRCERDRVAWRGVAPAALKKWATGRGVAQKDAMRAAAYQRLHDWGVKRHSRAAPLGDDEADAILLAAYALERLASGDEWLE